MSYFHKATPIDDNGVVKCYEHALKASLRTSNTTHNPGRLFYCCSKDINDTERCKFFYWADDPIFKRETLPLQVTPPLPSSQPTQVSTTPGLKRSYAACQQPPITPSQKRLRIMEDALSKTPTRGNAAPGQRLLSSTPAKIQRFTQIESALSSASQNSRTAHRRENSSKTNHYGPETHLLQNAVQTPATESGILSSVMEAPIRQPEIKSETDEDVKSRALLTPPRTFQELEPYVEKSDGIIEPTASSQKGKERAKEDGIHWHSNDPENPFEDSSSSNADPDSLSDFSADLVSSLLNNLNAIPNYLRRLERQKVAAEKSNQAKANKIFELEEEIVKLKLNKQELEELIKNLESH